MTDPAASPDDPVANHPLASRLRRAFQAHPVLKGQQRLVVEVEFGRAKVTGAVYTQDMLRQVREIVARLAEGDDVIVAVEAEVRPVQDRTLEGRVPLVSPGAGSTKRNFSTSHLERKGR